MSKLYLIFPLSLCTLCLANNNIANAQIVPDNTVGSQVSENGNSTEITGGSVRGNNLFHSFQDFSVTTGNEAFFDNSNDISNIFSRVTGGSTSNINGLIRANGSANLFLINPAGIIFGENARLDIGGSFLGSTSNSILFPDGVEFAADDLQANPILTVNAPIGLGFRDNAGEIVNNSLADDGRGLSVSSGNSLSLLGGNVTFNGGRVTAPAGTINLGGLSAAGEIAIDGESNFSFAEGIARSDVSFADGATVDVTAGGGGLIAVNANNLELTGASLFLANIGEDLGAENAVAGTIELNTINISADGASLIQADNLGTGRAGAIDINTDTLNFTNGSAITATTFGQGDAGNINVTARDITIDQEFSGIYSNVGLTNVASESLELDTEGVVGNAGIINIDTENLTLLDGARIITTSIAQGDGGTININATGTVLYQGIGETPVPAFGGGVVISGSFSQVQQEGVGNAGSVNITADSLRLFDVGAVLTDNSGVGGDAGDINLDIANDVVLDRGALILAQVQEDAVGNGGDIIINANSLEVGDGSFILADTRGIGDAGNIDINVEETVTLTDDPETGNITAILTEVQQGAVGNAGNINIQANALILENGANIAARTRGEGNAGDISISTNEAISLQNGSSIISLVDNLDSAGNPIDPVRGNGGNITITTGELNLINNSEILADTAGISPDTDNISSAGDIKIDVTGDINLSNGSQIQSQTRDGAIGNAGNIEINAGGSFFSRDGNLILADSQATGNGANITFNIGETILLEGREENGFPSQIVAGLTRETSNGEGGTIEINAGELIMRDTAFISSNTVEGSIGQAGSITLNVGNLDISENAFINAFTANDSAGGSILVNANTLNFTSGGKIFAATDGAGDAGNIDLNISDRLTLDNSVESTAELVEFPESDQLSNTLQQSPSGIYANTTENATGGGGNINIGGNVVDNVVKENAPEQIFITNNAIIDVSSLGEGSGGNIFLAADNLELNGNTEISAATQSGEGGIVNLKIGDRLILDNNSLISAEAFNNADGGNLNIDSRFIIAFPNGNNDILASAQDGIGGNININTESLLGIQERSTTSDRTNDINASSDFSLDGTVEVNILNLNPIQGITELPSNVVDTQQTTAQACTNADFASQNNFVVQGRGGTIAAPDRPLKSSSVIIDGQIEQPVSVSDIPEAITTSKGKIQPARGIKVTDRGEIILTAYRTNNSGERIASTRQC